MEMAEATPILIRGARTTPAMLETRHHWLPVILAIFLPVTFIITYSIAVAKGHVEAGFPYISDTGTFPPESCVFGQLLNIGAVISGIILYIRYRHIYILFENVPERKSLLTLNTVALWVGMFTNLGVSMVGNFQESNILPIHLLGAFLAFFVGWIYCVLQTVISFKTSGASDMMGNTPTLRKVRVALCAVNAVFIVMAVCAVTLVAQKLGPGPGNTRYKWDSNDPGYTEHLIATISEWLAALVIVIYFSTFYHEFKHFRVTAPHIVHYHPTQQNKREEQMDQRVPTISDNIT